MTEADRIWDTIAELERKIANVTKQINQRLDSIEATINKQTKAYQDSNKEQK